LGFGFSFAHFQMTVFDPNSGAAETEKKVRRTQNIIVAVMVLLMLLPLLLAWYLGAIRF
jgi:lipopolysaccharide/colanic/teichoic acid biosynthesis glycosyltransferase